MDAQDFRSLQEAYSQVYELDEGQKKYPTEKVENAGNRKVRTLRDPNISPEKRLKTTKQLNTITTSFMSHLTNRPQPVPPKRRK